MMKLAMGIMLLIYTTQAQLIPSLFTFPLTAKSVNGSSSVGRCTEASTLSSTQVCRSPTSSVVYDGIIPTLTGLDGNMWASQLLTINASNSVFVFHFDDTPNFAGVRRVEMMVFNCPQWGISLTAITAIDAMAVALKTVMPTLSSCDSLVRVCIENLNTTSAQTQLLLRFFAVGLTDWVHIAEVGFYADSPACSDESIITRPTAGTIRNEVTQGKETGQTTTTLASPDDITTTISLIPSPDATIASITQSPNATTVSMTQCPSCSTSTTLASVITAITTALLATLIFALLLIALCKYHPKFTRKELQSSIASAEGEGLAGKPALTIEKLAERGVAVSEPVYTEVKKRKGSTMKLMKNQAYGTTSVIKQI